MRRSILVFVVVGGLIALAEPAAAKCGPGGPRCLTIKSARAVIRGPGLDRPVVVEGGAFWDLARRTGISGYRSAGVEYAIEDEFPGERALGPRYRVRYVLRIKGRDPIVVAQDLYPYAVNEGLSRLQAAWAFTPKGQRFVTYYGHGLPVAGEPVEGGWWRSAALFQTLVARGLPKTPPVAIEVGTAEASPEGVATHESAGGGPRGLSTAWGWIMLLSLAAALLIATLTRRFRSRSSSV